MENNYQLQNKIIIMLLDVKLKNAEIQKINPYFKLK